MGRDKIIRGICLQGNYDSTGFSQIGEGGSGFVYKIKKGSIEFAVKVLTEKKLLPRFEIELAASKSLAGHGAIPIVEDGTWEANAFYIMPLMTAVGLHRFENYGQVVAVISKIAAILNSFAVQGFFHRDIKPNNIVIDLSTKEIKMIDLGLVKDTFKPSGLTKTQERIGSLTFMAPERIRPAQNSNIDTEKADVYSFGMTAWALLTEQKFGFGGQYSAADEHVSLGARGIDFRGISVLEKLIFQCTSINPAQRPSFSEVCEQLTAVPDRGVGLSDFYSNSQFAFRQTKPDFVVWHEADDIRRVLNSIIKRKYPLEILLHDGDGWLNLEKVVASERYEGMLEIYANSSISNPFLFDPNFLLLANFQNFPFYILESKVVTPFPREKGYDEVLSWLEPVCEIAPNRFTYEKCFSYNDFQGNDAPAGCRAYGVVTKGRFLIQLINNKNQLVERVWQEEQKSLSVAFPLYEKSKKSKLRKKMRFVEPTSFKCRRRLLTILEEESIKMLVGFIKEVAQGGSEVITTAELSKFWETRDDSDFLKTVCQIAQCTVNNFITDPYYMPLDDAIFHFNISNPDVDEYHIDSHPRQGVDVLLRKLRLFLYKYSTDPTVYLKG